jgi:hypothetical protein
MGQLAEHFRSLRIIFELACVVLERFGIYPRGRPPIVFMMEEFPEF